MESTMFFQSKRLYSLNATLLSILMFLNLGYSLLQGSSEQVDTVTPGAGALDNDYALEPRGLFANLRENAENGKLSCDWNIDLRIYDLTHDLSLKNMRSPPSRATCQRLLHCVNYVAAKKPSQTKMVMSQSVEEHVMNGCRARCRCQAPRITGKLEVKVPKAFAHT